MKNSVIAGVVLVTFMFACTQDGPESVYSGRTISYDLFAASENGVPGQVEFRERVDKTIDVIVTLDGLNGEGSLPSHLHLGDLSQADAPQAVLLNNFDVESGSSSTTISMLADETPFTFEHIEDFNGSVKIHAGNSGDAYNTIVSAGNIGSNEVLGFNLQSISTCGPDLLEK